MMNLMSRIATDFANRGLIRAKPNGNESEAKPFNRRSLCERVVCFRGDDPLSMKSRESGRGSGHHVRHCRCMGYESADGRADSGVP